MLARSTTSEASGMISVAYRSVIGESAEISRRRTDRDNAAASNAKCEAGWVESKVFAKVEAARKRSLSSAAVVRFSERMSTEPANSAEVPERMPSAWITASSL